VYVEPRLLPEGPRRSAQRSVKFQVDRSSRLAGFNRRGGGNEHMSTASPGGASSRLSAWESAVAKPAPRIGGARPSQARAVRSKFLVSAGASGAVVDSGDRLAGHRSLEAARQRRQHCARAYQADTPPRRPFRPRGRPWRNKRGWAPFWKCARVGTRSHQNRGHAPGSRSKLAKLDEAAISCSQGHPLQIREWARRAQGAARPAVSST